MWITFLFLGLFRAVLNGVDRVRRKNLISQQLPALLPTLADERHRITGSGYNLSKFLISRVEIKLKAHRRKNE